MQQTWHTPEIDITELPGSMGVNESLKTIVLEYCRQVFAPQEGFVKLLCSEKATNEADQSPSLDIYVTVGYPEAPQVNREKRRKFRLVSFGDIHIGEERLRGEMAEYDILNSAIKRAKEAEKQTVV